VYENIKHPVRVGKYFIINILLFHENFVYLLLKAVSPWVGLCFQDILVWCTYGNASWRHHRHDIKKDVCRTLIFYHQTSQLWYKQRRWRNRNVHVGDFISRSPPFHIQQLYMLWVCCTRIYYLMTWA